MDVWGIIGLIIIAGAIGGVANALATDNSFPLPRAERSADHTVWRAGVAGNMFTAAVAAVISWGLYGPSSAFLLVGKAPAGTELLPPTLTVATLATAVLIGFGGARWLTNEVDKKLLRAAASEAAAGAADPDKARQIAVAGPADAFKIASGQRV